MQDGDPPGPSPTKPDDDSEEGTRSDEDEHEDEQVEETSMHQGVVIDGPVAGAKIVIRDAQGSELAEVSSGPDARFVAEIPADAAYPLTLTATGGVNLTTGTAPEFVLRGVIGSQGDDYVSISAPSTLLIASTACGAFDSAPALQSLLDDPLRAQALLSSLGFGFSPDQYAHLLGGKPETPEAAARLLLASESLAEVLRRASSALDDGGDAITLDALLATAACHPGEALPEETASAADRQRMAAFRSAATAVNVELLSGRMRIASLGEDVTSLLEQAVVDSFGFEEQQAFDALSIGGEFLEVLQSHVYAMLASYPAAPLFDLYADLLALHPEAPRGGIEAILAKASVLEGMFQDFLLEVVRDETLAEDFLAVAKVGPGALPPPDITLTASPRQLQTRGGSSTITYTATHADVCHRIEGDAGAWQGLSGPEAALESGPIDQVTTLHLSCAGPGGIAETSIEVTIPPAVHMSFSGTSTESSGFIALGDSLQVKLVVVAGAAEDCTLVRSDTGAVVASGDTVIAAPGIQFEATCEGPGGMAMSAMSLPVRAAKLTWVPPSETEQDQPLALADLAGYRIYHGTKPGQYDQPVITISDPERTEFVDSFPAGTRYFAMTALSKQGSESRLSNEVIRDIP